MAFLVCVKFSGYGALQRLMYCVPAPLNAALGDGQESSFVLIFLVLFGYSLF